MPDLHATPATPVRAVLFDAAGTLIALREPVGETYSRFAADHGVRLSAWRIGDAFGRIFAQAPPMVFPDASPQEIPERERAWWRSVVRGTFRAADGTARFDDFDAFFAALYRHYARPDTWQARPGSRELLAALHERGVATAVVSNFDHRLPAILDGLGLHGFATVVLPADAGAAKPDPRIFREALARLDLPARAALFVGDHPEEDLAGARCVGLHAVDATGLASLGDLIDLDVFNPHEESR